ncbi:hypothetical protein RRG08_003501 [Elysia crispata]|uniref:Uncharacterized protein n=1 Tax=Elysia crispata TaxID=231223 RepID=A0AAE0Y6L6_9GAST|nr:hypothetical protein RRG08_003501 [Elysia crispata]
MTLTVTTPTARDTRRDEIINGVAAIVKQLACLNQQQHQDPILQGTINPIDHTHSAKTGHYSSPFSNSSHFSRVFISSGLYTASYLRIEFLSDLGDGKIYTEYPPCKQVFFAPFFTLIF